MDINQVCKFAECQASEVFEGDPQAVEALAEIFAKASRGGPMYEVYNTEMDVKLNGQDGWRNIFCLACALQGSGTGFNIPSKGVNWVGEYGVGWVRLNYSCPFDSGPSSYFTDGYFHNPYEGE